LQRLYRERASPCGSDCVSASPRPGARVSRRRGRTSGGRWTSCATRSATGGRSARSH